MYPESPSPGPDLVETLVARVDEIDAQLRATTAAIDEKSLKEFRRTFEALSKRDAHFEERLVDKVDVVADRLETVTRTVSTTSAALAAKDGEIAQLRRGIDAANARTDSILSEMRRGIDPAALDEVRRTVADLAKQKLPRGLESRIDELGAKATMLAERIDTVSSTASMTAAGLAGRDGDVIALRRAFETDSKRAGAELVELRRALDRSSGHVEELARKLDSIAASQVDLAAFEQRFRDATSRVDGLVSELTRALFELPDPDAAQQLLEARLRELDRLRTADRVRVEELAERLESVVSTVEATTERGAPADALVERIDAATEASHKASSEVARLVAIVEVERATVRSRLESLAAELDVPVAAARTDEVEREHAELVARIDRLTSAFEAERTSFQTQLEALATALSWTSPKSPVDERLADLDRRLEDLERQGAAIAARVSQTTTLIPTALRALETRLDELGPAPRTPPTPQLVVPPGPVDQRLERTPDPADDEHREDELPERLPTTVVPARQADP